MNRIVLAATLLLAMVSSTWAADLKPYSGTALPDFALADLAGKEHRLSGFKGKVVMVNFWATYCTPCIKEMPSMARLKSHFKGQPFEILAIDMAEDKASIEAFLKRFDIKINFPILVDPEGEVVESWMISAVPTSFLIDRQGKIRYALFGAIEWDSEEVKSTISGLLKK